MASDDRTKSERAEPHPAHPPVQYPEAIPVHTKRRPWYSVSFGGVSSAAGLGCVVFLGAMILFVATILYLDAVKPSRDPLAEVEQMTVSALRRQYGNLEQGDSRYQGKTVAITGTVVSVTTTDARDSWGVTLAASEQDRGVVYARFEQRSRPEQINVGDRVTLLGELDNGWYALTGTVWMKRPKLVRRDP